MAQVQIFIFGCSGIAKTIVDTLKQQEKYFDTKVVIVDKNSQLATEDYYRGIAVIGREEFEELDHAGSYFILAFYKPIDITTRLDFAHCLVNDFGMEPITLIDSWARISPSTTIGEGCYIAPGVVVDADVIIGKHCIILFNSIISRECRVASNNFISAGVIIKGSVVVGESNFISASCNILKNIGTTNFLNAGVRYSEEAANRRIIYNASEKKEVVISDNSSTASKQLRFLS